VIRVGLLEGGLARHGHPHTIILQTELHRPQQSLRLGLPLHPLQCPQELLSSAVDDGGEEVQGARSPSQASCVGCPCRLAVNKLHLKDDPARLQAPVIATQAVGRTQANGASQLSQRDCSREITARDEHALVGRRMVHRCCCCLISGAQHEGQHYLLQLSRTDHRPCTLSSRWLLAATGQLMAQSGDLLLQRRIGNLQRTL
jgi:hypothetical protein